MKKVLIVSPPSLVERMLEHKPGDHLLFSPIHPEVVTMLEPEKVPPQVEAARINADTMNILCEVREGLDAISRRLYGCTLTRDEPEEPVADGPPYEGDLYGLLHQVRDLRELARQVDGQAQTLHTVVFGAGGRPEAPSPTSAEMDERLRGWP